MPWTYLCEDDNVTLVAETKEQLVEKVWEHGQEIHKMDWTREQAEQSVNQNAKQAA